MNAVDRILQALRDHGCEPRGREGQWSAKCPAHEDQNASLSIGSGSKGVVATCHAGCSFEEVMGALDLLVRDSFDDDGERPASTKPQIDRSYGYRDEQGELLFEVVRFTPKSFRQRTPDGNGGWSWKLNGVRRVPYRLPQVRAAITAGEPVYLVEGEKDADRLAALGLCATTTPQGAGNWRSEYGHYFANADLVIIPDNDAKGWGYAAAAARSAVEHRAVVRLVQLPGLPEHGDVSDWLVTHDIEELKALVEGAPPFDPSTAPGPATPPETPARPAETESVLPPFQRWSTADLLDADLTFAWTIRGMWVAATYGVLGGGKKTLKSYLLTFMLLAATTGTKLFDHFEVDEMGAASLFCGEGGRVPYTRRLIRVAEAMGIGHLRDVPLYTSFETAPMVSARFVDTVKRDLEELEPAIVAIDPLYVFHPSSVTASNLYERGAMLSQLSNQVVGAGSSCLVLDHWNKTGTGKGLERISQSGMAEWADSWLNLDHRTEPDVANGRFSLSLEIGSRQWGGSTWDLDLDLGRFDEDLGEFDGQITWDLHRATGTRQASTERDRLLALLAQSPWTMTKEEIVKALGGNASKARTVIDEAVTAGVVATSQAHRPQRDGRMRPVITYGVQPNLAAVAPTDGEEGGDGDL